MMSEKKRWLTLWVIGVVVTCIVVFLALENLGVVANAVTWCFGLVSSLIVGLAFAIVINVPMRMFESILFQKTVRQGLIRLRRPLAYIISLILILGILAGIIWLVIPELIEAITVIVQNAINMVDKINTMDDSEINELPFGNLLLNVDWDAVLGRLKDWLKNKGGVIVGTAVDTISSLVSGIFDFFVSFVFSIYILFNKEKLKTQACRLIRVWLPKKSGGCIIHAFATFNTNLRNFIFGQSLEAVIIGVLCMAGMFIFRLPYAAPVGALVGVTALIPIVGSFIGAIVGAFLIVTVSPIKAVIFIIYLIVLQQLEGNLIYPRVMSSRVSLPGMWILAAVTVGGGIAGPVGMLLSVPMASTLYVLCGEATDRREEKLISEENKDAPTGVAVTDSDLPDNTSSAQIDEHSASD